MNGKGSGRDRRFLALQQRSAAVQAGLAFVFPGIALLACELFRPVLTPSFEPPFIAAVALAAWIGGPFCGFLSGALSAVAVLYFYIPPYNQFEISGSAGWVHLATFAATNVLITILIRTLYKTRTEVQEAEARFRSATDLIPFGVWKADQDGKMEEISESFLAAFGTTMTRCAGLGWTDLLVQDQRNEVLEAWKRCVERGEFWDWEYHMKGKDGGICTVLSRGVPVVSEGRRGWIGIHLDVTEREKATAQRLEHQRDIARFNAELDQFAYVAAHDLQEPLRMIASYLQLIARRYRDALDEDGRTFISYSVEGATRLQALLQGLQLLSVVGKLPERRRPTPLSEAVSRAKEILQEQLETSGATITCGDLPVVHCDRFEVIQLFENLFDNAIRFTRDGERAQVSVNAERDARFWHITVRDDGIGIDPEYLNRIFDLFQRLNPRDKYPGTGIGLTICKKIVEVHGGRIWAESKPGAGTAIHFTLPA